MSIRFSLRASVALILGAALAGAACAAGPVGTSKPTGVVKILSLNDFHGQLESPGTFRANATAPLVPAGGVDYAAGYIAAARAANPNTVVVAAGDLIGASPLVSALFHDEPTIETMNRAGIAGGSNWTCPTFVESVWPASRAFRSNAMGLWKPSDECRLTGL